MERTRRSPSKLLFLPRRQRAIVRLIVAEGLGNSAIAARLGISRSTVRNVLAAIYQKLGLNDWGASRLRLVLWARKDIRFLPSQLGRESKVTFRIYTNDRGRLHGTPLYSCYCEVDAIDAAAAVRMVDPKYGHPEFAPIVALSWPVDVRGKRWLAAFTRDG